MNPEHLPPGTRHKSETIMWTNLIHPHHNPAGKYYHYSHFTEEETDA